MTAAEFNPVKDTAVSHVARPKLILHICCAICGAYFSQLLKNRFDIIYYYYNPNIHPEEEYAKRKEAVQKLAEINHGEFIEGDYDVQEWHKTIAGFEGEPEGGNRCPRCFRMRLDKTATLALAKGATYFATTLTASPYKNETVIEAIGLDIARKDGLTFLTLADFDESKADMWKKTLLLSKEHGFYRQNYCGCTYSIWKK